MISRMSGAKLEYRIYFVFCLVGDLELSHRGSLTFLSRFSLCETCVLRPGELAKLRSGVGRFFVLGVFMMFSAKIAKVYVCMCL